MTATEIFVMFLVSHAVGDFLLQTDHQARHKFGGLGRDATARRALFAHLGTYVLAFVPALLWLTRELSVAAVVAVGALIVAPHLVTDDGRLLRAYARRVKGLNMREHETAAIFVDQSVHVVALYAVALVAAAWAAG